MLLAHVNKPADKIPPRFVLVSKYAYKLMPLNSVLTCT